MTGPHITRHAIERYQQRVERCSCDAARAALDTPAVHTAAAFGARVVKLGTGQRIIIGNGAVITVLGAEQPCWRADGQFWHRGGEQ